MSSPKIRVLIVDDSAVARRFAQDALADSREIEVIGTAANGLLALEKIASCSPDVVILDLEMPEMNGLATLAEMNKRNLRASVLMFSNLTQRGARQTLEALALGALDYVAKPASNNAEDFRRALLAKVKALGERKRPASTLPVPALRALTPVDPTAAHSRIELLVLAASTGGPKAISEVLEKLGAPLPIPTLIVQHMPAEFTKMFAERLAAKVNVPVREAVDLMKPQPREIYIAPGDFHLSLISSNKEALLKLDKAAPENHVRPAADVLFRSAAAVYGPRTLAVVLTGMGQDGLEGARAVRKAGGQVIVQDEATSVVWGMPGIVARSGIANAVVPLGEMANEIVRRIRASR
jgi:two-component system chemotaxis response regulator CheB